eukprot:TRINITY_DN45470_c0_g1_i1.p1 TRINITY_DN45470_c0_g1~~TRINITY_DN45470_c0_g1_i1.p1  ORF type:complete len:310 (-),score=51.35 TRINITY_DN45470_c0_g1_i1:67-885(-)
MAPPPPTRPVIHHGSLRRGPPSVSSESSVVSLSTPRSPRQRRCPLVTAKFEGRYGTRDVLGQCSGAEDARPMSAGMVPGVSQPLANYLNDMKRSGTARRYIKDWKPSPHQVRMNDRKVKLCAERVDETRERNPASGRSEAECVPASPRTSEEERAALFARKKQRSWSVDHTNCPVRAGRRCMSAIEAAGVPLGGSMQRGRSMDILNHDEAYDYSSRLRREASLARSPSRYEQADARFAELGKHMGTARPDHLQQYEEIKARGIGNAGQFSLA